MTALINEGVAQVRRDIIAFLRTAAPLALAEASTAWGLAPPFAAIKRWNEYEDEVIADITPSVALSVGRSRGYTPSSNDPGADMSYRVRYDAVLFLWLKATAGRPLADGGEQQGNPSQRVRDRYAQVFTAVLLDSPSLGQPGYYSVTESSLTVAYSAAQRLKGDRYLSGVSLSFDLYHSETLQRVPLLGSVVLTEIEATVIPDDF